MSERSDEAPASNFIRAVIEADLREGRCERVVTRFPPEPNGYLHIGHAKAIRISYSAAMDYGGIFHLRFDDTNPVKEDREYVEAIMEDIAWLGADWGEALYFASDAFERMYALGEQLIRDGRAYVCHQTGAELRASRGSVTEPGTPSPYRDRPVEENLALFRQMRAGDLPDGHCTLRAKGDMAAANMKLRDPPLYRIRHATHHRTGDAWCIYPMYDYAHPLEDALEGITHSLCSLEFSDNRAVYDWVVENAAVETRPRQYEFARLSLAYTVLSKRKLIQLVEEGHVSGWDDPRMPTISGLRRRGYTAAAINDFVDRVGVAKVNSLVDIALLEYSVRKALNHQAPRVMAVLDPLRVVITNWPEGQVDWLEAPLWPHDVPREGSRRLPFSGALYIERADFREDPPRKFFRLAPGREVRLRYGYYITCEAVVRGADGAITELRCRYDPDTRGGDAPDGRKVKGTLHWVSAAHAVDTEVRLYDRLFNVPRPEAGDGSFIDHLNRDSLTVLRARAEPYVAQAADSHFQFERLGYFARDPDSSDGALVFNRTVTLKDTWGKLDAAERAQAAVARAPGPPASGSPGPRAEPRAQRSLSPAQAAARDRYAGMGLGPEAEILALDAPLSALFEAALAVHEAPKAVANWVVNEVPRLPGDGALSLDGAAVGALVALVDEGAISGKIGKKVLAELAASGGDPAAIVRARGWSQITDPALIAPLIERVLAAHSDRVEQLRGGREGLLGFFVGQVIKASSGRASPDLVQRMLREAIGI